MRASLDRRGFLRSTALAAGALAARPLFTQALPQDAAGRHRRRRLVLVMLDGGNDGLNTLAPIEDAAYHRARPALALKPGAVHRADELNGFHPALARTAERFREGGVCVLRGVGYAEPNLSHFKSRDIWETASSAQPAPATGWLGRLADELQGGAADPLALLSVGAVSTPLALRAERNAACVVPDGTRFRVRSGPPGRPQDELEARRRALAALNGKSAARGGSDGAASLPQHIGDSVAVATAASDAIAAALERAPHAKYPDSKIARDLGIVARVIDADLPTRCFYVAQPGYDTHAAQAQTHAELLGALDAALEAFLRDLAAAQALEDTLVLCWSEFGRRVAENGIGATAGTDHGAASLVMLLGGGIQPGLHGGQPALEELDANGNLSAAVDFRCVYADAIEGWFGASASRVLGVELERAGMVKA